MTSGQRSDSLTRGKNRRPKPMLEYFRQISVDAGCYNYKPMRRLSQGSLAWISASTRCGLAHLPASVETV